jgi:hypothetical protein
MTHVTIGADDLAVLLDAYGNDVRAELCGPDDEPCDVPKCARYQRVAAALQASRAVPTSTETPERPITGSGDERTSETASEARTGERARAARLVRAALEKQRQRADRAEAEVARLRAGEADHLPPEDAVHTPAEWIRRWNDEAPEKRLEIIEYVLDAAGRAHRCFLLNHEARLADAAVTLTDPSAVAHLRKLAQGASRIQGLGWNLDPADVIAVLDGLAALDEPEAHHE